MTPVIRKKNIRLSRCEIQDDMCEPGNNHGNLNDPRKNLNDPCKNLKSSSYADTWTSKCDGAQHGPCLKTNSPVNKQSGVTISRQKCY